MCQSSTIPVNLSIAKKRVIDCYKFLSEIHIHSFKTKKYRSSEICGFEFFFHNVPYGEILLEKGESNGTTKITAIDPVWKIETRHVMYKHLKSPANCFDFLHEISPEYEIQIINIERNKGNGEIKSIQFLDIEQHNTAKEFLDNLYSYIINTFKKGFFYNQNDLKKFPWLFYLPTRINQDHYPAVLKMWQEGKTNKEISQAIGTVPETIPNIISMVLRPYFKNNYDFDPIKSKKRGRKSKEEKEKEKERDSEKYQNL